VKAQTKGDAMGKQKGQEDADILNGIIKDLGITDIKATPINGQVNLFQDGVSFPPVAGCNFSDCFAFLKGYKYAKTGDYKIDY
jgi:hypothetical protein